MEGTDSRHKFRKVLNDSFIFSRFFQSKNFHGPEQKIYIRKSPILKLQTTVSVQNFLGNYGCFKQHFVSSLKETKLKKSAQKFSKLNSFWRNPSTLSQYSRDNPEDHSIFSALVLLYTCFSESNLIWFGQNLKTPFEFDKYVNFEAFSLRTKF